MQNLHKKKSIYNKIKPYQIKNMALLTHNNQMGKWTNWYYDKLPETNPK